MPLRFLRILLPGILLLPGLARAQSVNPCFAALGLPCLPAPGALGLAAYAEAYILRGAMAAFLAIAIWFFFYYGVRLLLEGEEESTISETKSAYGYGIAGAAIVSLAGIFADAFSDPTDIVDPEPIRDSLALVIRFMFLAVSISVTAAIVFLGVRLILLQGNESEIEQQKKRFFHGLLGVAVILLADVIVGAFLPGYGSVVIAQELVGIINFILTLLGALAVLAVIIAGIMLVVSVDEGLKDRARKTIFTTVIALIVVFCALLIVRFVLLL